MDQDEYLVKEYELCFEQLRFYDNRQEGVLKFLFTLSASVATAEFAVLQFVGTVSVNFLIVQACLSILVFIGSLLLVLSMVQNRLYFVFTARQLNAIRGYFMSKNTDFDNNQLWISTDFSALKSKSVHTFQLKGAVFLSSLFLGSAAYSLTALADLCAYAPWVVGIAVVVSSSVIEYRYLANYLVRESAKSSDESIHNAPQKDTPTGAGNH